MKDKQIIRAGAESTNVQATDVIINQYQGLTFADAKEIAKDTAMEVFKSNFYDMSELAKTIALERAEILVSNFLLKLEKDAPETIHKIERPDVQYDLINAQKQYARSGKTDTLELLTDLLKTRFQVDEGSFKGIVLSESIEVMSKLTINQIRIITAIFLVKNCIIPTARDLIENLSTILTDQFNTYKNEISFFEHLMFVGVAANDITVSASQNLEHFIKKNYPKDLDQQFVGKDKSEVESHIRNHFSSDPLSENVFVKWNTSLIGRYSLTSVGKAIAIAFFNAEMNAKLDLDIWIKG